MQYNIGQTTVQKRSDSTAKPMKFNFFTMIKTLLWTSPTKFIFPKISQTATNPSAIHEWIIKEPNAIALPSTKKHKRSNPIKPELNFINKMSFLFFFHGRCIWFFKASFMLARSSNWKININKPRGGGTYLNELSKGRSGLLKRALGATLHF